jgi:hypothetical protein
MNFDVWLEVDHRTQVLVEVKLTEDGFARARRSARRTPKLATYREALRSVLPPERLGDDTLLEHYQLCRNLSYLGMCDTHVMLLTPRANPRTALGVAFAPREVLPGSATRLHTPWIEDVLESLSQAVEYAEDAQLRQVLSELREKYQPTVTDNGAR